MAEQVALDVVVLVVPGHGDVVGGVGDVEQAVVVVRAVAGVAGQVVVVDPDVGRLLDVDGVAVAVAGQHLGDLQVADDDVVDALDLQPAAGEAGARADPEDRLVGRDGDVGRAAEVAADLDGLRGAGAGRAGERRQAGDGNRGAGRAAAGAAGLGRPALLVVGGGRGDGGVGEQGGRGGGGDAGG